MLTGAGKALGMAFGAAGGFAAFAGVTSLTGAVQSLVGEAADAYAYSERLRMSLSSMAAKEFLQSGKPLTWPVRSTWRRVERKNLNTGYAR
jgi:hypothetical protein